MPVDGPCLWSQVDVSGGGAEEGPRGDAGSCRPQPEDHRRSGVGRWPFGQPRVSKDLGLGAGGFGLFTSSVIPPLQKRRRIGDQDLSPKKSESRVSVDHKLTRTGFEKGRAAPPLFRQLS